MTFVWDEAKDRTNRRKYGIAFEAAYAVSFIERVVDDEERWPQTIGTVEGVRLLLVVHTLGERYDDQEIRIISARKANKRERNLYEAPQ